LLPLGVARWLLPSDSSLSEMRSRQAALSANIAAFEQRGGKVAWRRCGEQLRLCVRIDKSAPVYGEHADFYVLEGY
jgi:hypothetical protein